jgi:hypothetical protein
VQALGQKCARERGKGKAGGLRALRAEEKKEEKEKVGRLGWNERRGGRGVLGVFFFKLFLNSFSNFETSLK